MTLSEIRDRVRLFVPEAPSSVISNINLNVVINDGVKDITMLTGCLESTADANVVAGTQEYDMPTDLISLKSVYYGGSGNWEKLPMVNMEWLAENVGEDWQNNTGEIYGYYVRSNKIGLYQVPTSSEAGTTYLKYYYVSQPDSLASDGDIPFNSLTTLYPYHELVYLYTNYKVKQIIGKWEQAKQIQAEYGARASKMRIDIQKSPDFKQPIRSYHKGVSGSSMKQNPLDQ